MNLDQSNIQIIKRDGRTEPYDKSKLFKVVLWACNGNKDLANIIISSLDIKITDRIEISRLYDELITTTANLISPIQYGWDEVAKNLLLMKLYKESYNLKSIGYYPEYSTVVQIGIQSNIYNKNVFDSFSTKELEELGDMIDPNKDLIFTYKGLYLVNSKYCARDSKSEVFELPQHFYLRMAIQSFYNETDKELRMKLIKSEYDIWSIHDATAGTPRALNSLSERAQLASCVLSTMDDDTDNINDTLGNLATYSKFSGGLALDVSHIRSSGSRITGNKGISNGPVPFIKDAEAIISSFNQGGLRPGSCVVTFPEWHIDVRDMIMLKDAGGAEDNRARKLKYTMRMGNLFKEKVEAGEKLNLFNPQDVPMLNCTYGDEFSYWYSKYSKDNSIRKKSVEARSVAFDFAKVRKETGNIYLFFTDNVNIQSVVGDYTGASNLCTEITVTSTPSKNYDSKISYNEDGKAIITTTKDAGEIGLCNLLSINLVNYYTKTVEQKRDMIYTLLRGADNIIDTQFYPVKEAKLSNTKKRPIGIGVTNYANLMASLKIKFTDHEAKKFTHELFEELYYLIYDESCNLARERGPFEYFKNTRWANGETPLSLSILNNKVDHELNYPLLQNWDLLSERVKLYGVRFSLHGAIAPTATSGRIISATESTEPLIDLFLFDEGTQSLPSLAPNLAKNRMYYELAYDIPAKVIIELAAIRQKFIDQAQSINLYYVNPNSAKALMKDIFYAMELGVKTLYYQKSPKSNYEPKCESCT